MTARFTPRERRSSPKRDLPSGARRCTIGRADQSVVRAQQEELYVSNSAVRVGLIYGLINAVIGVIVTGITFVIVSAAGPRLASESLRAYAQRVLPYLLIIGAIEILVIGANLLIYFLAGRSAAAQDGSVGSGAVAGLLTAIVAGLIGIVISVALNVTGVSTSLQTSTTGTSIDAATTAIDGVFGLVVGAGFGAGIGALGGLLGKSAYERANPAGMPLGPMGMPGAYPGAYPPPPGGYPPQPMQ